MLELPVRRRGEVLTLTDGDDRERIAVMRARPRLARRDDGSPRLRLLRWVAPDGGGGDDLPEVGGRLSLDVSVEPTAAELAAAGIDAARTEPVPWLDASVRIHGPGLDPVIVEASLADRSLAGVGIDLTRSAAAVLAPLLEGDVVSPLQVAWAGHVRVRLPAVEVLATVEVDEVIRRVSSMRGAATTTLVRAIIDASARIRIEGIDNPELERSLREWALDELTARFESGEEPVVSVGAAEVVRWPISLSSTLDDVIPREQRQGLVDEIVLQPGEAGARPPTEVRVLADFDGRVERVDVQLRDPVREDVADLVFTDGEPRRVPLNAASFQWRRRFKLAGGTASGWSAWRDVERSYSLVVPVAAPSTLTFEVVAVRLDFAERWSSVKVTLEHETSAGVPDSGVVELDADHTSVRWHRDLDGPRGTVRARLSYRSRRGLVVEREIEEVDGEELVVVDPFDGHRVERALLPTGNGWDEVALAMVDLRYRDGPYTHEEAIELRGLDDFAQWRIPARPDGPDEVEYRLHVSFTDGRFERGTWKDSETAVLKLTLAGTPRREVQLLPVHFDAAVTPRAEVRLRSGDHAETVDVTGARPRTVVLPPGPFRWRLTFFPDPGDPIQLDEQESDEDVLVLPRPPL